MYYNYSNKQQTHHIEETASNSSEEEQPRSQEQQEYSYIGSSNVPTVRIQYMQHTSQII